MRQKIKNLAFSSLVLILLYLLVNQSSLLIGNLEGQYFLHDDGYCHFLLYEFDTLLLKNDGSLISNNFQGDATYRVKKFFFEKQIEISFNHGTKKMTLPIERTIFGETRLRVCMDQSTFYIKTPLRED